VDYSIKVTNINGTDTVPVALYNAEDAYAADIIFLQAGAGAVARTVESKLRDTVSVKDFGAVGNGVADDTAAIQAAIDSFASGNGTVYFPTGSYKVSSTITVSKNRIHLTGAGSWAAQIVFAPTASTTCIKLSAGAAVLFQGSVTGLSFYSTDSTYTKTAIEIIDTSGYLIDDIVVGGSIVAVPGSTFWSGGPGDGSRGIWIKGREACKLSRLYIYADKPIEISQNPNSTISIDHFHFQDTYLGAVKNCVLINDGVNLTNVTFDGYNAWVLGTNGLYWVDTTTAGVSQTLVLRNVRWEQGLSSSAWCVRIEHNSNLQGLTIEDCQGGFERNGYRFRKVVGLRIANNINTGGAGRTVLDVDTTVPTFTLSECLWQTGATASLAHNVVYATTLAANNAPLPTSAVYQSTTVSANRGKNAFSDVAQSGYQITVADGAVANLGNIETAGILTVLDNEYFAAQFLICGTNGTTREISDPFGVFSATAGTATSTNVYWSAGNSRYEIQNNRGVSRNYKIVLTGSYGTF
jgi:hypothetical protein